MIRETNGTIERTLMRKLVVVAVENTAVGDWAAYVVDYDEYRHGENNLLTPEQYAQRAGDKLSRAEALRYFRGPLCPHGEYRE